MTTRLQPPDPEATVVLLTCQAGPELDELLDRLVDQCEEVGGELLVIDSGSRDGTLERIRRRSLRCLELPRRRFNHGLTRNLGVAESRSEVVAFLSQDALPEPGWLGGLVDAFADPRVAGAYGRQLPRPSASPFARDALVRWPAAGERPVRQAVASMDELAERPLDEVLALLCFDNVSSALRRSVWEEHPFRDLRFGEDREWAYRVLAAGHTIAYRPESRVVHSHDRSGWYELKRSYLDHRALAELLGGVVALPDSGGWGWLWESLRLLDVLRAGAPSRAGALLQLHRCLTLGVARSFGSRLGRSAARHAPSSRRLWPAVDRLLSRGV